MPSYFPENNDAKPDDTEVRSLQKINDLLSGGITVSVGEVEVKNDAGNPVPVTISGTLSVSDRGATGEASVTSFTSTSSATLKGANSQRKVLTIYNEGSGNLHILYGAGTASTTNYSVKLFSGDYLEINQYVGQVTGIFASAGTARVTEIT
jgi:hypothetical protein